MIFYLNLRYQYHKLQMIAENFQQPVNTLSIQATDSCYQFFAVFTGGRNIVLWMMSCYSNTMNEILNSYATITIGLCYDKNQYEFMRGNQSYTGFQYRSLKQLPSNQISRFLQEASAILLYYYLFLTERWHKVL